LGKFSNLLSVNLEDNSMHELPGAALQQAMPQCRELNINQNPLDSHEGTVAALKELPNLISLYMSLFEEEAVHLIIKELPNLQYLNGIEIQRAAIPGEGGA
jgi:hypothetical protein